MGSVSPKTDGTPIDEVPIEDEEDMTSVMSSDQRKALQKAAKTEKESATLERDTARPPPSEEAAVSIPRAAPIPAEARPVEAARAESAPPAKAKSEPAPKQAPARSQVPAASGETKAGWATWELVAFLLLAAAIATALRG
ncbi:MAG TPA: hypothetical protein VMI75_00730 [Polyangiaceae bacterium]|nr:hypothetical protein [Polyangiaceae bacterium]